MLRRWNSRTSQWVWTPAGRNYYEHNRQRFIINVPCLGYIPPAKCNIGVSEEEPANLTDEMREWLREERAEIERVEAQLLRSTFYGHFQSERVIPLTEEALQGYRVSPEVWRLAGIGLVRDQDHDQASVQAALRRAVLECLHNTPTVDTEDGNKHKIAVESVIIWCWDESKELTFDEQIVRHLHGDEQPLVEALLDRPLLGVPCVDEKMYGRQGLCPIAALDLTDRGGCMVAQIVETVKTTRKVTTPEHGRTAGKKVGGSQQGGKDTRAAVGRQDNRIRMEVPRFTAEQVTKQFDEIFAELYPGDAVDEEEAAADLVEPQRSAPYEYAGWREVGVTTKMCSAFCDRNQIGLRVLYKNTVIWKNDVDTSTGKSVIVYHIHGDHAFFYDDKSVKNGASQLRQAPPRAFARAEETIRLRTRGDEDDLVPFADMQEFELEAFKQQVVDNISKTFYCYQGQVKDLKQQIDATDIPIWVGLGNRPELIRSLNVCQKKNKDGEGGGKQKNHAVKKIQIRVKVVPDNALQLQDFCAIFSEHNNWAKLVYAGESTSVIFNRALTVLCTSRRMNPQSDMREMIKFKQECKCSICGDTLGAKFEIDHISPLCLGGTNEADNLRAICTMCHAEETDRLLLAGLSMNDKTRFHTIESHLSPKLWRELHNAPKPKEVSRGTFNSEDALKKALAPKKGKKKEALPEKLQKLRHRIWGVRKLQTKTKHVGDLLAKHPAPSKSIDEPAIPQGVSQLKCMDAKGCRLLALTKRTRGLPIFSPLDEWETFNRARLGEVDFVYIDMGKIRLHDDIMPYTGSRLYAAEACEYLLAQKVITEAHCKASLRATRHVPSEILDKHLQTLKDVCEHMPFESEHQMLRFQKQGILSMIGLWNATSQHAWKQIRSNYQVDAGNGLSRRKQLDDGSYLWTTSEEIVDLYSMAPWGRIALDVEQVRIAQATATLKRFPDDLRIAGAHVDGVFFLCHSFEAVGIYSQIEDEHRFSDGSPMFHLKNEPVCKVPTWTQPDVERAQEIDFSKHKWRILQEEQIEDTAHLARLVEEHRGLLLTGPAGTGKSYTLGELMPLLSALLPGKHLAMALRHCTAMIIGGKTIAHYLHKYRRKGGAPKPGTIVIIDEWSEVQLHTWIELARWKLVGVIFILVGDADGQRKPSYDRWQDAMNEKDIRESQLVHELCGGLRVKLTTYRRGTDPELFKRYTMMYKHADDESKLHLYVDKGMGYYPYEITADCYFVMSHKSRMALNHAMNFMLAERQTKLLFLKAPPPQHSTTMQPQDMLVWEGLELLCYSRRYQKNSPVTGAVYIVKKWDEKTVTVELHPDYVGKKVIAGAPEPEVAGEGKADDEGDGEESDAEVLDVEDESAARVSDVREGNTYKLSHARAAEILRLQHALVYASIQGRTFRQQHIALMDLNHRHFTMRDLITAMSRPTAGEFLHFVSPEQQVTLMQQCEKTKGNDLKLRLLINHQPPSERPNPSRVGRR